MTDNQENHKNIFVKIVEFGISWHYIPAGALVVVAGFEFFYKKADKEGVIALCLLLLAVVIETFTIFFDRRRFKRELLSLTQTFDDNRCNTSNNISNLNTEIDKLNDNISYLHKQNKNLAIIKYMNQAFSDIRNHEREDAKKTDKHTFIDAFTSFCNTLNTAFSHITEKEYHVCIKLLVDSGNIMEAKNLNKLKKFKVRTFIREGKHLSTRASFDKNSGAFIVKDNTDFNLIVDTWITKQKPFVCNDLIGLRDYKNSRFIKLYGSPKNDYDKATYEEKETNWQLPYKSCITAPIGYTSKNAKGEQIGTIFGFLCIDCEEKNAFDEDIHPLIIAGCAEGLYNTLKTFLTKYP